MRTSTDLRQAGERPTSDVVVVGAGPTGLTAALLLARDGVAVQVVDKNTQQATESRALVVQARTVELWAKLGLAETARAGGAMVRGAYALLDGRELAPGRMTIDLTGFGAGLTPYPEVFIFGQDQTERMLLAALADLGVTVERDTEVVDLDDDPHDAHVVVRTRTDGVEQVRQARYVIGADGAHSTVRRRIGATFDGAPHEGTFFLTDAEVEWDRGYGDALTVALDSGGGMALFVPMPDPGGRPHGFRVFGSLGADFPVDSTTITLADVQRRLDTRGGIPARLHDPTWVTVYRLHSRMADRFSRGRVFLAGDAAHIHTPTGGQGMNTGIQDAYNLAWKLSAVLRGHARHQLLDSYPAERQPVARALLAGTDTAFDTITANGRLTRLVRPVAAALLPTLFRIPAVGRRAFTTISQIAVRYPDSPVVTAASTTPPPRAARSGDRAPYAPLAGGNTAGATTVFDLLTGTDHHLLLFAADHPAPHTARDAAQLAVDRTPTPIRLHLLDAGDRAAHRAYDSRRPTMLLIRPDGHIAWRGGLDDTAGLTEYLGRWYRTGAAPAAPPGAPALPPPGDYRIDPDRSTLAVSVPHWFGRGTVTATVPLASGTLTLTGDPDGARAYAEADATGFRSGHAGRDRTVASRRLLDTTAWPTITYTADGLRWNDASWELPGILTAHGRSHYLALRATAITPTDDGAHTITCRGRLDRHDLGITGLPGIVGRTVTLDLTLHAVPSAISRAESPDTSESA